MMANREESRTPFTDLEKAYDRVPKEEIGRCEFKAEECARKIHNTGTINTKTCRPHQD